MADAGGPMSGTPLESPVKWREELQRRIAVSCENMARLPCAGPPPCHSHSCVACMFFGVPITACPWGGHSLMQREWRRRTGYDVVCSVAHVAVKMTSK